MLSSLLLAARIDAAPSYDAYADGVNTSSAAGGGLLQDANDAVGAPDNNTVGIAGANSSITLDMGEGEEGTGNLVVHNGLLDASVDLRVEFLDASQSIIKTENTTLAISIGTNREFTYNYADYGKAYRFVRISNLAVGVFNLDAVEAKNYIGMTDSTDTDGGGMPDRTEQDTNGTDPQNPNDDLIATTNPPTTGTPEDQNPPVDSDGDGMPDEFENENGLNPAIDDSMGDPDNDGITNLFEFKKGGNPQVADEFILGTCTASDSSSVNAAQSMANMYMLLTLFFLVLFLLAVGGMLYYRSKYTNSRRTSVT